MKGAIEVAARVVARPVILKQANGFTYGALMNQIWSVAGSSYRTNVSQLFVQPFFTYNWKSGAGIGLVGSITQNWETQKNSTSMDGGHS